MRNEDRKAAFVRDIERIEPENFTGALDGFFYRDQRFFQLDADISIGGDFVQCCREATAREVAQAVDFDSGIQQRFDRGPDAIGITENRRLEFKAFADGEDCDAVAAKISADDNGVAGLNRRWADRPFHVRFDQSNAGGVDEDCRPPCPCRRLLYRR